MNSTTFRALFSRSWPLLAVILIATVWLYRTPYSASDLEVLPDSVEYALAPLQFLETGRYEIIVEGRGLPSRYPPWFPVLVILPAYALFGHDPGNAILPITLLAVAGIGFAYTIGKRISSTAGGLLAALFLLFLSSYSHWASQVMTDVPCTALMLAGCLLYLQLLARPEAMRLFFGSGVLVAITTLFRPEFAAMLLPFLLAIVRQWRRLFLRTSLLLAPMAIALAATFAYNASTFGSCFRNGYSFWTPFPYDYPSATFSLSYVSTNLLVLRWVSFPILILVCVGAVFLVRRFKPPAFAASRESFYNVLVFFLLTASPILLFHLFYFFPDDRFYLPALAAVAVLAGSMLGPLAGPRNETIFKLLLPVVFLIGIGARIAAPDPVPARRVAAEQLRRNTPDDAIIISGMDPVYLARLAASGSGRRIVPLSRNVEFAWALLVRKRVDDPRLRSLQWENLPQALEVLRPHAEQAVRFVASERMDELTMEIKQGRPVFFESAFVSPLDGSVVYDLLRRFKLIKRAPNLHKLEMR